jgi:hypothetical protein
MKHCALLNLSSHRRIWFSFATLAVLLAAPTAPAAALRILMLGNSYTDSGSSDQQVWQQVQNFLNADPDYAGTTVTRYAPGGWQLYDHATSPTSTNWVTSQPAWDFVILQDQSYTPSHAWLYGGGWWNTYVAGISPLTTLAKSCGAKVIYYETWARAAGETGVLASDYHSDPIFMQDNLSAAYNYVGTYYGVKVAPVGEAWEKSLQLSPALILHQSDLSHMNNRGAYLTAAVFYRIITGKDPAGVNYLSTLPPAEASTLRANLAALSPQPNTAIDPSIPDNQLFAASTLAPAGTILGRVQAANYVPPAGTYVQNANPCLVRYEIVSGNASGLFSINSTNGSLTLAGAPAPSTNTLGIRVTDSNNWQANNTVQVLVRKHPYHVWSDGFAAIALQSQPDLDPDGDGIVNALEYAFGGQPDVAGSLRADGQGLAPVGAISEGRFTLSYFRRANPATNGLTYSVQVATGTGLNSWQSPLEAGYLTQELAVPWSAGWERVSTIFSHPGEGANACFVRVAVQLVP